MAPFTVRRATAADVDGVTRVHLESWKTSYAGLLPASLLDHLDVEGRRRQWANAASDPSVGVFVAERVGTVVGLCAVRPNRESPAAYRGELAALYLLDEAKGQGIGKALFAAGAAWLAERGLTPFLLWVLADNARARRFYEARGGQRLGSKDLELGGKSFAEVSYGFSSAAR